MNLPSLPLIGGSLFIDNSGWVEGFNTCYRLLQFKSLNLRISKGEKVGANFGSAIHLAKELRYARYGNRPVDQAYYDDLTVILTDFFAQHPPPADDWRTLNWAMETVRRINDRYEQEEFNLMQWPQPIECPQCNHTFNRFNEVSRCLFCKGSGKREYMVELSFALPLYTHETSESSMTDDDGIPIPVIFTGRIDLPLILQGEMWTMDTKTTSQLGDQFWNGQRISAQHRGYGWALREVTGVEPKGFIVDAVRTKQPPSYVQNGTTFKGKVQTPAQWWQESLQRDRMAFQPGELDRWKHNTIDLCEEFFWHYSRGYMPMKTSWCNMYGKCQYYDVCRLVPEDQGALLASGLFTNNEWTPLVQPTQAKS